MGGDAVGATEMIRDGWGCRGRFPFTRNHTAWYRAAGRVPWNALRFGVSMGCQIMRTPRLTQQRRTFSRSTSRTSPISSPWLSPFACASCVPLWAATVPPLPTASATRRSSSCQQTHQMAPQQMVRNMTDEEITI